MATFDERFMLPVELEDNRLFNDYQVNAGTRVGNKLFGTGGEERFQTWPERMIRSGFTLPADVYSGREEIIDPLTGRTSEKVIERAQDTAGMAGMGSLGLAPAGAITAGPSLRPALKYEGKLYKGKEGQQHADVIPQELYPEFQRQAMSGEDISNFNFGFINHKGQFLTREKALEYAVEQGLMNEGSGKFGALTSTMYNDNRAGTAISGLANATNEAAVNIIAKAKAKIIADMEGLKNNPAVKAKLLEEVEKIDLAQLANNQQVLKTWYQEGIITSEEGGKILQAIDNGAVEQFKQSVAAKEQSRPYQVLERNAVDAPIRELETGIKDIVSKLPREEQSNFYSNEIALLNKRQQILESKWSDIAHDKKLNDDINKQWNILEEKIQLLKKNEPTRDFANITNFALEYADKLNPKSRDKRAEGQGYLEEAYHGAKEGWTTLNVKAPKEYGFYSTANPELADMYAGISPTGYRNPQVMPLKINTTDYLTVDAKGKSWSTVNDPAIEQALSEGKKGVIMKNVFDEPAGTRDLNEPKTVYITLDPSTVRSKFARFDPDNVGKNGIMFTDASAGTGLAANDKKEPRLVPVDYDPFKRQPRLVPVDYNPFENVP